MNTQSVEEGDYGYVVGLKGKYKGQVVYYDDDASEKSVYIYPGHFIGGTYSVKPRNSFRPASIGEILMHEGGGRGLYPHPIQERRPLLDHANVLSWLVLWLIVDSSEEDALEQVPAGSEDEEYPEIIARRYPGLLEAVSDKLCALVAAAKDSNGDYNLPAITKPFQAFVRTCFKQHVVPTRTLRSALSKSSFVESWYNAHAHVVRHWARDLHPLYAAGDKVWVHGLEETIVEVDTTEARYYFTHRTIPNARVGVTWEDVEIHNLKQAQN